MVIILDGKVLNDFSQLYKSESLKERNLKFSERQKIKFVLSSPTLHVFQKEYCVVNRDRMGDIQFVGSSEATTCAILCLYSLTSGTCFLAHLDSHKEQISMELSSIVHSNFKKEEKLICHLVGCYIEDSECSERITNAILEFMHKNERQIEIQTFMVMKYNSVLLGGKSMGGGINKEMEEMEGDGEKVEKVEYLPIFRNLCVDVKSGEAYPSVYPNYISEFKISPEYSSRCVRICNGNSKLYQVHFDTNNLRIIPFTFSRYYSEENIRSLLCLPDDFILNNFSTSPNAESDTFVTVMKLGYEFLLSNPSSGMYFKGENDIREFVFEKDNKGWRKK